MSARDARRARLTALRDWCWAEIDSTKSEIDALAAITGRTAVQNVDLRHLRRWRKLAIMALLALGMTRDTDLSDQ